MAENTDSTYHLDRYVLYPSVSEEGDAESLTLFDMLVSTLDKGSS